MTEFHDASGPLTLEDAIEHAKKGRPVPLLNIVHDTLGAAAAEALDGLLRGRIKLVKSYKGAFTRREAEAIAHHFQELKALHPDKTRDQLLDMIRPLYGSRGVDDAALGKHTYKAKGGEQKRKTSPPKRKR